jgi:hypothetical protein
MKSTESSISHTPTFYLFLKYYCTSLVTWRENCINSVLTAITIECTFVFFCRSQLATINFFKEIQLKAPIS